MSETNYGAESVSFGSRPADENKDDRIRKALLWVGAVSAVSAVAAFVVVRATVGRTSPDPTSDRIQSLIDEANQLLKQIDQSKH
jgi:hypothetical protein